MTNEPNSVRRWPRVTAHGPRATECAKRTQFRDKESSPRRHREHRDMSKYNSNKELRLMLCGLCVSVLLTSNIVNFLT